MKRFLYWLFDDGSILLLLYMHCAIGMVRFQLVSIPQGVEAWQVVEENR